MIIFYIAKVDLASTFIDRVPVEQFIRCHVERLLTTESPRVMLYLCVTSTLEALKSKNIREQNNYMWVERNGKEGRK